MVREKALQRARVPQRYWDSSYKEISKEKSGVPYSPQQYCERYLKRVDDFIESGTGLLLYGNNGTGKTAMAVVIAKVIWSRGKTVLFLEAAGLISALINREMFDAEVSMRERMREVDCLIIDDLGKGNIDRKGFYARAMDELLRHRVSNRRVTIMTTNMQKEQLGDQKNPYAFKPSTMSALKESVIPIPVVGKDRREINRPTLWEE